MLCDEEMVLAVPESFYLDSKAFSQSGYKFPCLKAEDWIKLPFIALNEDQLSYSFAERYMSERGFSPRKVLKIRNLAQAILAVKQGLGIKYFSLYGSDFYEKLSVGIVHRKDDYISMPEKKFIEIYAESYA